MNTSIPPSKSISGKTRRALFFAAGSVALALGAIGIVLPVLPTTPFLLLSAYCYARSSPRAHRWLLSNRVFGRQLQDYMAGRGVSRPVKAGVLALLWLVIVLSGVFFVPWTWARVLLGVMGIAVSVHILALKTKTDADPPADQRMPES